MNYTFYFDTNLLNILLGVKDWSVAVTHNTHIHTRKARKKCCKDN